MELGRQPGGDGNLVGTGRVAAREKLQHRAGKGSVRILGAELIGLVGARHIERLVLNDLHPAVVLFQRGYLILHVRERDPGCLRGGRRQVEGGEIAGSAVPGVWRWRCVDRHCGPDDDRGDRHDDEEEDEELLAPLPPEEAPGPTEHRPAGRDSAAARHRSRTRDGSLEDVDAHWFGTSASRASGPSSGSVWSMTRPSRKKTTRSAHDASCASCVTTNAASPRRQAGGNQRTTLA